MNKTVRVIALFISVVSLIVAIIVNIHIQRKIDFVEAQLLDAESKLPKTQFKAQLTIDGFYKALSELLTEIDRLEQEGKLVPSDDLDTDDLMSNDEEVREAMKGVMRAFYSINVLISRLRFINGQELDSVLNQIHIKTQTIIAAVDILRKK
jgi:hypothetical protein